MEAKTKGIIRSIKKLYGKKIAQSIKVILKDLPTVDETKKERAPTAYNTHLGICMRELKGKKDLTKKDKMEIVSETWKRKKTLQ